MAISIQPTFTKRCSAQRAARVHLERLGYPRPTVASEGSEFSTAKNSTGSWVFQTLWRPVANNSGELRRNLRDSIAGMGDTP